MPRPTDDDVRQRYGLAPDARIRRSSGPADKPLRLTPDSFTVHEVESTLEWSAWERAVVVAGTTVNLTVQGAFVGEGSPLSVSLHDARGAALGRGASPMYRDRAFVAVDISRQAAAREPDGVLCAADVTLTELKLGMVSAPLLVLPFAQLVDAQWGSERAAEGETVSIRCRVEGSAAGVERLGREPAQVAVFVRSESETAPFDEPVASFQVQADRGQIRAEWAATLGLDRWGLLSQAQHDAEAARVGAVRGEPPHVYDRPHLVFRVRLAGIEVESPPLAIDDSVNLVRTNALGEPVPDARYVLTLADGSTRAGTLDAAGTAHELGLPPGPVRSTYPDDVSQT